MSWPEALASVGTVIAVCAYLSFDAWCDRNKPGGG